MMNIGSQIVKMMVSMAQMRNQRRRTDLNSKWNLTIVQQSRGFPLEWALSNLNSKLNRICDTLKKAILMIKVTLEVRQT